MKKIFICMFGVDYDLDLAHHWMEHYTRLGLDEYHVWLHSNHGRDYARAFASTFTSEGFDVHFVEGEFYTGNLRNKLFTKFHSDLSKKEPATRIMCVDSDEFVYFGENGEAIPQFLDYMDRYTVIEGKHRDRWGASLVDAHPHTPISLQYPKKGNLWDHIIQKGDRFALHRHKIIVSAAEQMVCYIGSHNLRAQLGHTIVAPGTWHVDHFTWRESILRRMVNREYYTSGHIYAVQEYFKTPPWPEPHEAVLAKHKKEYALQQSKGWE